MSWEIAFVFLLLGFGIVSFIWEKISSDLTAMLLFAGVLLGSFFSERLPQPDSLFTVFSNPAPLTIGAMFVVSAALEKCGALDVLATFIGRFVGLGYHWLLLLMILVVAMASAFINNTPVVVMLMPIVLSLSRQMSVPASKMLIPLSYASIFGGTCTVIGTSTNILASSELEKIGQAPLSMFELGAVGLPLMLVGTAYLVLIGYRFLPSRETLTSMLSEQDRKEYILEVFVKRGSSLIDKTINDSGLLKGSGLRVLEILRKEVSRVTAIKDEVLREGDRILLACHLDGIEHARNMSGLDFGAEADIGLETLTAQEGKIVEGVIGPNSSIVGKTLRSLRFRNRYRTIVLAIHRRGVNMKRHLEREKLEYGDTLLMMGTDDAIEQLRLGHDILLLDHRSVISPKAKKKTPWVLGILLSFVLVNTLTSAPIAATVIIACVLLFATGCLTPKEGYESIEWHIIILIFGMLGMGMALQTTGAAHWVAEGMAAGIKAFVAEDWLPIALLAALYLTASLLTEFLSNNATIVLMAPIGFSLAQTAGADPKAFIIASCIAASASFSTPIGYQTNTYVYGVGGYRFTDFFRVGLPLNLIYFTGTLLIVPIIWPL